MSGTLKDVLIGLGFDFDGSGADRAEARIKSLNSQVNTLGRTIRRGAIAFGAIAGGEGLFLNEAGNFEKTTIAFETMMGTAERGRALLKELEGFSLKTAFGLDEVEKNAAMLRGMGVEVDSLIPTMKSLGDVAAGINRPLSMLALNFGQVRTRGVLIGTELRDFTRIGVPLLEEMANHMGKTEQEITNMVSERTVTFKMVEDSFKRMTSEGGRFADLMLKQAKTLPVILSNTGIAIRIFARHVGKELLPDAKKAAKAFGEWLSVNEEFIKVRLVAFFQGTHRVVKQLWGLFTRMIGTVDTLANVFGGLENVVTSLFWIFSAFVALQIFSILGTGAMQIVTLTKAMYGLATAGVLVNATIGLIPLLIGAAIVGLGLLADEIDAIADDEKLGFLERKAADKKALESRGGEAKGWDYFLGGAGQLLTKGVDAYTENRDLTQKARERIIAAQELRRQERTNPMHNPAIMINVDATNSLSSATDIGGALSTALRDSQVASVLGYVNNITINAVSTGIKN